jgi:hypothetical protein
MWPFGLPVVNIYGLYATDMALAAYNSYVWTLVINESNACFDAKKILYEYICLEKKEVSY